MAPGLPWSGCPNQTSSAPQAGTPPRRVSARVVRLAGILVALLALSLCGLALADQWRSVKLAIDHADYRLLLVAFVAAALGMSGLGVLWWQCLRVFGERTALHNSIAWYFGGELGKYLPGGIWPVLGRGELAHRRGGISRSTGYATTLISYAAMVAAAAVTCGFAAPVLAIDNHVPGWEWLIVGLIPLAVLGAHPAVFGRLLGAARRATKGRVDLETPSWSKMLALIAIGIPTWVLVGVSSVFVARALGFDQNPVRIAFAAVAAWIIGFLAVPVPAGVGLRELIFVALCGLPAGPAAAVAAGARLILVCVDGVGGAIGLCVPGISARTDPEAQRSRRHHGVRGGRCKEVTPFCLPSAPTSPALAGRARCWGASGSGRALRHHGTTAWRIGHTASPGFTIRLSWRSSTCRGGLMGRSTRWKPGWPTGRGLRGCLNTARGRGRSGWRDEPEKCTRWNTIVTSPTTFARS